MIAIGLNHLKNKSFDEAIKIFGRCLKELPNGQQIDTTFLGLLTAHINRKKIKEAEASLAQFRVSHPASTVIQQAEQMLAASQNRKQ
jgi:outer membrane protein assembly factor BamD (BamD/ComL family)